MTGPDIYSQSMSGHKLESYQLDTVTRNMGRNGLPSEFNYVWWIPGGMILKKNQINGPPNGIHNHAVAYTHTKCKSNAKITYRGCLSTDETSNYTSILLHLQL